MSTKKDEVEAVAKWMVSSTIPTVGFDIPTTLLKLADTMRDRQKLMPDAEAKKLVGEYIKHVTITGLLLGYASGEVVKQLQDQLVAHKLMED
jgi:hypothetical protein